MTVRALAAPETVGMGRIQRLATRADEWALSSESEIAPDTFARIASRGELSYEQLVEEVLGGRVSGLNLAWVARLARIIALQLRDEESQDTATRLLEQVLALEPDLPNATTYRKLLVELYLMSKDHSAAEELVARSSSLANEYFGYLQADVINPFSRSATDRFDEWLTLFNRPFVDNGLTPVSVELNADVPFNTLGSTTSSTVEEGPLVSVLLTTFKPDADELMTSVKSILMQTWQNIEVLLIDDASGAEYETLLHAVVALDKRVRLVRMPTNGGTYRARNAGLEVATGEFVTGQDTDDWSHPERLEVQVTAMLENPESVGVTVSANRTDDNLQRAMLGNKPRRRCEVSLMVRTKDAKSVGGYLPVRRAADSEFRERIEKWSQRSVLAMDEPLYMIRLSPGSLSRSDFRTGWSHHARRAFRSAYTRWHVTADRSELALAVESVGSDVALDVPPRIYGSPRPAAPIDVCFVADWRGYATLQRAALDELNALVDAGLSVAIHHLDSPFAHAPSSLDLSSDVQNMLNRGLIRRIYDDTQEDVKLAIVRDPSVMHFCKAGEFQYSPLATLVVCDGCDSGLPAAEQLYDPQHVANKARTAFQAPIHWIAGNPAGCDHGVPGQTIGVSEVYSTVVAPTWFHAYRPPRSRGSSMVIGRAASNSEWEWPKRRPSDEAYPRSELVDVRVLGDPRGGVRSQRQKQLPANWMHFLPNEIAADVFWSSLDCAVYFSRQGIRTRSLFRAMLESMAVGTPIATTEEIAAIVDGAALATTPEAVIQELQELATKPGDREELIEKATQFVRLNHSAARFEAFIVSLIKKLGSGGLH